MTWQTIPIKGWAPDLPPDTPGYLSKCDFVLPAERGIIFAGYPAESTATTMPAASMGGMVSEKIDGTKRVFAGTVAGLYELTGASYTVLTDRSAYAYSASTLDTWSFSQYGDISLAINKNNRLQQLSSASTFVDATSAAPMGSIVITCGPPTGSFAMVLDYYDGSNNYQDGWFCSALSNPLDWTPSIATQCANNRLLDVNGRITAAIPFRDGVLAWKKGAMYEGTYEGPPAIWTWRRVASNIGCIGKNAVCNVGDVVYWADEQGLWMYDGSYPQPIPGYVHNWWSRYLNYLQSGVLTNTGDYEKAKNFVRVIFNSRLNTVFFCLPYATTGDHSSVLAYNTRSGIWTRVCGWENTTNGLRNDANTLKVHELIGSDGPKFYAVMTNRAIGTWEATSKTDTPNARISAGVVGQLGSITTLRGIRLVRTPVQTYSGTDATNAEFAASLSSTVYHSPGLVEVMTSSAPYSSAFTVNTVGTNIGQMDGSASNVYLRADITVDTSIAAKAWEVSAIMLDVVPGGQQ
jgi:hypothetical protein